MALLQFATGSSTSGLYSITFMKRYGLCRKCLPNGQLAHSRIILPTYCPGSASGLTRISTIGGGSTVLRSRTASVRVVEADKGADGLTFLSTRGDLESLSWLLAYRQVYIVPSHSSITPMSATERKEY
jgi:hypothetical protein